MKTKAPAARTAAEDVQEIDEADLQGTDEGYERVYVVVRKKSTAAEPEEGEEEAAEEAAEPAADADETLAEKPHRFTRRAATTSAPRIPEVAPKVWAASLASGPLGRRSRRRTIVTRVLTIVPAVALVAVTALLCVVWQQKGDLSADARQQRDLAASARKVADVFFNWDYQHMAQSFAAKYPLLTKAAADAIRPTADTLTSYFTTNKVSSRAAVTGVYPGAVKHGAANVMVVINTKVTTGKTVQANSGATVALSMKLVSGKWLAGNITLLSQGVESATDENGKPITGGTGSSGLPGAVPSARPSP
ncbi:hypothetical protein [Actinomadura nitritigenes]|uniref:hypothetical protein n=1 Tax=Actinomadura nitritigenes TaxID=134602 RepID=UPI003D8BE24C